MQQDVKVTAAAERMAADLRASCLGVRVGRLSRLVGRRYDQALRPLGLSVAQLEVLGTLTVIGDSVRPADLATWLAVERSTMSRNLSLMEERGYVQPTELSPSGRSQRVAITQAGRTTLAQAELAWRSVQGDVEQALGRQALPTLDAWISSLAT